MTASFRSPPEPRRWARARAERERAWLDTLHEAHHHARFIAPDPLELVVPFGAPADREVAGLVAASLAYGNVTAMLPAIERVLDALGPSPATALDGLTDDDLDDAFADFRYRVTPGSRLAGLLAGARRVRARHGSLESALAQHDDGGRTLAGPLAGLVAEIRAAAHHPLDHLLPSPVDGSACKRPALWLRWLVREDVIDPGGWDATDPARLFMPLDTHVFRTARDRRWTRRRTPGLTAALEVTARLRQFEPSDPLRWDFAITRPGIRGNHAATRPEASPI